jgi:hypothetical protein
MPTPNEIEAIEKLHEMAHTTPYGDLHQRCHAGCEEWLDDHLDELDSAELLSLRNAFRDADEKRMKQTTLQRPRCSHTKRIAEELDRRTKPVL